MARDKTDCTCPGARKYVKGQPGPDGRPVPEDGWYPNGPETCAVHPHGYDRDTGSNE